MQIPGDWFFNSIGLTVLASPPSSPVEGQVYYDQTAKTVKVYDGSQWNDVGTAANAASAIIASQIFG